MKQLLVVLLMLCPVGLMAQTNNAVKDFPLTVKVTSSKWLTLPEYIGSGAFTALQINVLISGKEYVLRTRRNLRWHEGLLKPGDYKARLIKNKHQIPSYQENQSYLLQFPDGKTQRFYLEAVGK